MGRIDYNRRIFPQDLESGVPDHLSEALFNVFSGQVKARHADLVEGCHRGTGVFDLMGSEERHAQFRGVRVLIVLPLIPLI